MPRGDVARPLSGGQGDSGPPPPSVIDTTNRKYRRYTPQHPSRDRYTPPHTAALLTGQPLSSSKLPTHSTQTNGNGRRIRRPALPLRRNRPKGELFPETNEVQNREVSPTHGTWWLVCIIYVNKSKSYSNKNVCIHNQKSQRLLSKRPR